MPGDITYFLFDRLDSTNEEAKRVAAVGCPLPVAFVARIQDGGRGRRNRAWSSPDGGLWMSLLLSPSLDLARWSLVPLAAAVGIVRAMREVGVCLGVKWPNDLLLNGKKVCGILVETLLDSASSGHLICGLGLNLNVPACEMPEELRDSATSILIETGLSHERYEMAGRIGAEVLRQVRLLESGGHAALLDEWREMSVILGKAVRIVHANGGEEILGTAIDVDETGALLVAHEGGTTRVLAGDVSLRLA